MSVFVYYDKEKLNKDSEAKTSIEGSLTRFLNTLVPSVIKIKKTATGRSANVLITIENALQEEVRLFGTKNRIFIENFKCYVIPQSDAKELKVLKPNTVFVSNSFYYDRLTKYCIVVNVI